MGWGWWLSSSTIDDFLSSSEQNYFGCLLSLDILALAEGCLLWYCNVCWGSFLSVAAGASDSPASFCVVDQISGVSSLPVYFVSGV